jgi:hypothetical protein
LSRRTPSRGTQDAVEEDAIEEDVVESDGAAVHPASFLAYAFPLKARMRKGLSSGRTVSRGVVEQDAVG